MTKRKETKGQTMIYKTLHRKLKIDQHEPSPLDNWYKQTIKNVKRFVSSQEDNNIPHKWIIQ